MKEITIYNDLIAVKYLKLLDLLKVINMIKVPFCWSKNIET